MQGVRGLQGVRGDVGPKGDAGAVGPQGPIGEQGYVGERGPQGSQGDMGCPGPQGEQGPQGERSAQGEKGEKGETGERGEIGPAPQIEVAEDTETVYRLRFASEGQTVESPNLRGIPAAYNADLSATGASMTVPLGSLTLTVSRGSADSIRLAVAPTTAGTSVFADIRRVSIYDGGTFDIQTNDSATISARLVLDDILYNHSREMHWMTLRMQDPATSLWSVCSVRTFCSTTNSSRTTVWVEWICTGVSYT